MAAIQKTHGDYTVAWICALPLEAAAATAMLEKTHPKLLQSAADDNAYTLGEVAGHNIVIACLPSGVYGTTSAATVAAQMRSTFPSVRFGLMVGIGGGVPSTKNDIRLGDIVVSKPTGTLGGVVQYDYGKAVASGVFRQTGMMNQPPQVLLNAIAQLQADEILGHNQSIVGVVSDVLNERVEMERQCSRPLREQDHLYDAAYHHPKNADTCIKCNKEQLINRKTRSSDEPQVHYGLVASGNQVMKDGQMRDRLAKKHGMLCFEMEAAGLMNQLPCLVIRGICDYCDSHKNKEWQGYAAITAAAYTKILLSVVPVNQLPLLPMDPLSVLSLASSIAGLVDIATRSITTLTELQARYTRVGLRFKQLAGQLSTLKAALNKIKHGIETHQTGVWDNEQLVSDLVVSIDCCESVMTVLDDKLIWFDRTQLAGLGVRMKAQSLWEESDIAEYQSMLNNQINALNLLLTVTQCESFMEQRDFLQSMESRHVFKLVKDDTSSLLLQRDAESFLSRQSSTVDNVSFVDREFVFDRDLFSSRAYRTVARSWMRQSKFGKKGTLSTTITAPRATMDDSEVSSPADPLADNSLKEKPHHDRNWPLVMKMTPAIEILVEQTVHMYSSDSNVEDSAKSKMITLTSTAASGGSFSVSSQLGLARKVGSARRSHLAEKAPRSSPTGSPGNKVLLLGSSGSGKSTAMKSIHLVSGRYGEYPVPHRLDIFRGILNMIDESILQKLAERLDQGLEMTQESFFEERSLLETIPHLRERCQTIAKGLRESDFQTPSNQSVKLSVLATQIKELWDDVSASGSLGELAAGELGDAGASYFFDAMDRVAKDDYTPSVQDTLWHYTKTTGVHEMRFNIQNIDNTFTEANFVDVGGRRAERRKWNHTFEGVTVVLFFVDIACYDEELAEDSTENRMRDSLFLFNYICHSPWLQHIPIVLILHKMDKLERKLAEGALPDLPDFEGDLHSVDDVRGYLTKRFMDASDQSKAERIHIHYTRMSEVEELGKLALHYAVTPL